MTKNRNYNQALDADVARKVVILLGKMKYRTTNSSRLLASYFGVVAAAFAPL